MAHGDLHQRQSPNIYRLREKAALDCCRVHEGQRAPRGVQARVLSLWTVHRRKAALKVRTVQEGEVLQQGVSKGRVERS